MAARASWSPERRAMLEAMGLMPLRLRPVGGVAEVADMAIQPAADGQAGEMPDRSHPLFSALCAAAGIAVERDGEQDLARWVQLVGLPGLPTLAADPQAKRRLWQRMRGLHRNAGR